MAIKAFEISFLISTEDMLAFVATRNGAVRINALSDGSSQPVKMPKQVAPPKSKPKLLAGPKTKGKKRRAKKGDTPSWQLMLQAFAKHPDHTRQLKSLESIMTAHGLSTKSISPQISMMKKKGYLKQLDKGTYQMTSKGGSMASQLGFHVAERREKLSTLEETLSLEPTNG